MPESAGIGTFIALVLLIVFSLYLGVLAQRVVQRSDFLQSYFLGNRGLGAWALALTATVQSGGTFMGFPSLVYSYGWIVALWISSYMVVPLSGFGILGKRLAQLSRRTKAITIPDLYRERFGSPAVGLTASLLILFFMTFMLVAQFKAGALVMKVCWPGSGALSLSEEGGGDIYYYIGLAIFSLTVVGYTLIGGFLAAVWTDLFQSVIMLIGVMILLPMTLVMVGGLDNASHKLNEIIPFKSVSAAELAQNFPQHRQWEEQLKKLDADLREAAASNGGKLPDTLEEISSLPDGITYLGRGQPVTDPGSTYRVMVAVARGPEGWGTALYSNGNISSGRIGQPGDLSTGPGPFEFLPLGLAFSFFFLWVFSGLGSPAGMVRVMASKSTETIRKSIYLLATYNTLIYLPLIVICICGRVMLPDLPARNSDEIIPRLAIITTDHLWGGSFLAGLILAAPFGAVMATVSSYLVVIASGLVRDIYHRFINPEANMAEMRRLSYILMVIVGIIAVVANLRPVEYLQGIVVFSGTCGATAFVVPSLMACFWRRATAAGTLAAMLTGTGTTLILYVIGWIGGTFRPYLFLGIEPLVWGLLTSLIAGIIVCLITRPPDAARVALYFDPEPVGEPREQGTLAS